MICSKCGKQLLPNEVICSNCGQNNGISDLNNNLVNNNQTIVDVNTSANVNDIPVYVNEVQPSINLDNNMDSNQFNSNKKSKKGLIITLSIVGVLLVLGIILLIINPFGKKEEEDNKKLIENSYTMYVKINPLVKLNVKEKYYECKNENTGKFEKCSDVTEEVVSYNLVNNDAKEIYKDIDLKMKNVVDALVALYDTARENELEFTNIEITTNWDNRYSKVELVDAIKKQTKYSQEFNIVLDVEKGNITTNAILNKYGIEEDVEITYTVVFNSDGGTTIPEQEVKENEKVVKPSNPTRDGYTFKGYYTEKNGGGTQIYNENMASDIIYKYTNNVTLYAHWVDDILPQVELTVNISDWTNQKVILTAEASDYGVGLKSLYIYKIREDGSLVTVASAPTLNGAKTKTLSFTNLEQGIIRYKAVVTDVNGCTAEGYNVAYYDVTAPSGSDVEVEISDNVFDIELDITDINTGN